MAANPADQCLQVETTRVQSTSLQEFVRAFNACETPKDAVKLVQDITKVLTALISVQSDSVHVSIASLAGVLMGECSLPMEAAVAELSSKISCRSSDVELPMTCTSFLDDDGSEVDVTGHLKNHARLTMKASLSSDDVGRLMYQAGDSVKVELLGQCLGHHGEFWKQVALSYPMNFACFAGMDIVTAIRAYLWCFRLPGEAAQIERIMEGFSRSYYHHNTSSDRDERQVIDGEFTSKEVRGLVKHKSCWDSEAVGWYVQQPLSGPKLLPCCVHCGALDGDAGDLVACQGCNVVHFCRKCRKSASRYGHAVVGMIGYGRACVAAKCAAGSLGPDYNIITFQRSLRGNGTLETTAVSEESLQWEAVSPFKTQDSVMVLAYAIIMLTTNLHSPNVKEKMKKHEFIKQNRGVNGNDENFPGDFLSKVYDDMQREKLTVMRNVN